MASARGTAAAAAIKIVPFEVRYQQATHDMFIECLGSAYANRISPAAHAIQKNFVQTKINKEGGDMYNIQQSFMSSPEQAKSFFIALDPDTDRVVGHVGVTTSTYALRHDYIYDESRDIIPETVCEIVRMGVDADTRGKGVGRKLCEQAEVFALSKGMKRIALSTLSEMDLAIGLYLKYGFTLVRETVIDLNKVLGNNHAFETEVKVSHLVKDL